METGVLLKQLCDWNRNFKSGVSNMADAVNSPWPQIENRPDASDEVE